MFDTKCWEEILKKRKMLHFLRYFYSFTNVEENDPTSDGLIRNINTICSPENTSFEVQ